MPRAARRFLRSLENPDRRGVHPARMARSAALRHMRADGVGRHFAGGMFRLRGAKALLLAKHRDRRLDALVDVESGHVCAKPAQLADVVLIPSIDVVDMADARLAFGDDAGRAQERLPREGQSLLQAHPEEARPRGRAHDDPRW